MHQATEERARLEREVADLRRQVADTKHGQQRRQEAHQQLRSKLEELAAVEPSQADYWDQLSGGWANALDPLVRTIATEVVEQSHTVRKRAAAEADEHRVLQYVVDQAAAAGFDVSGQDAEDFWGIAVATVDRTMPDGTLRDKTAEAINTLRRLRGEAASPRPAGRQPMGRSGSGRPSVGTRDTGASDAGPVSLDDAIEQTHGRRRV